MTRVNKNRRTFLNEPKLGVSYIKELRETAGIGIKSVNACILMQYLENRFKDNPEGFSMYITPPAGEILLLPNFRPEWTKNLTEELGMTRQEIEGAYKHLGVAYSSRAEYNDALERGDLFKGKYYCRYFRRSASKFHLTTFYRNHSKVEEAIALLKGTKAMRNK